MGTNKITYLKTFQLQQHPKNPRLNVGDVTELAESIKANGIMQNLTVVPDQEHEGMYTVIIGHRRLAAAKEAGLIEVPCAIKNLTEKEQQSIMLTENMQRSDLTLYEQAQGIQMCMDLGMSEDDLKDKTGFSKSTIHKRVKLLKFDKDKVSEGVEKGATLQDFMDLSKIEDVQEQNKLLKVIGTSRFARDFQYALTKQEKDKSFTQVIQKMLEATYIQLSADQRREMMHKGTLRHLMYISSKKDADQYIPVAEGRQKYFENTLYYGIEIFEKVYLEDKDNNEKVIDVIKNIAMQRAERIEEKVKQYYEFRRTFLNKQILKSNKMISSKFQKQIVSILTKILLETDEFKNNEDFGDLFVVDKKVIDNFCITQKWAPIEEHMDTGQFRNALIIAYSMLEVAETNYTTVNHYGIDANGYNDNYEKNYKYLYKFLEDLGYTIDDEERAIIFGTDQLYNEVTEEEAKEYIHSKGE